jgi:hypothetical protein
MVRRRWFQYSLKSLMAAVVLICLGLGGWHLLFKYGQYVEAESAVVGQPIKIRGRFFHFFASEDDRGYYHFEALIQDGSGACLVKSGYGIDVGWWQFKFETDFKLKRPGEYALTLTPKGGTPILGRFEVRGAE